MGFLSKILIAILILIAVNALAHGVPFLAAPETGSEEFSYDTSATIDDAARILVSLVGIGLIGFATFSVLLAWMIITDNRGGLSVTIVLGGTYLLISIYAIFNLPWVDAFIYGGFGTAITLLAAILWRSMAPASIPNLGQAPDQ